jgi:hypothetical protein
VKGVVAARRVGSVAEAGTEQSRDSVRDHTFAVEPCRAVLARKKWHLAYCKAGFGSILMLVRPDLFVLFESAEE